MADYGNGGLCKVPKQTLIILFEIWICRLQSGTTVLTRRLPSLTSDFSDHIPFLASWNSMTFASTIEVCVQAGAGRVASRVPFQGFTGSGLRNLRLPTGALAYGIPVKDSTTLSSRTTRRKPRTTPVLVDTMGPVEQLAGADNGIARGNAKTSHESTILNRSTQPKHTRRCVYDAAASWCKLCFRPHS